MILFNYYCLGYKKYESILDFLRECLFLMFYKNILKILY